VIKMTKEDASLVKGWKEVVISAIWKSSLLMLAFHSLRAFWDPLYCNVYCSLKLMNTSAPSGYASHPYWKDLNYGDSCTDEQLHQYVLNQSSAGEYTISYIMSRLYTSSSVLVLLYHAWKNRRSLSIGMIPALLWCGYWMANIIMMNTHFEQDITFLTGGILHHAKAAKPALDKKSGTNAQGYLVCGTLNRIFFHYAIYYLVSNDKKIFKKLNPWMVVAMMNIGAQLALQMVLNNHPRYHAAADGGMTPELASAWPWSFHWFAYYHVIIHHDSGYSFGGEPVLDPFYDWQLDAGAYLHNDILKLQLGTYSHYVFVTLWDLFQSLSGMIVIWIIVRMAAFPLKEMPQAVAAPEATGTPSKKKVN